MNVFRFIIPKSSVEYIYEKSTVRQALEKMRYHRYVAIPVIKDDGTYSGTLRSDDILKYFLAGETFKASAADKALVAEILDTGYCKPLYHSASMNELFEMAKEHNFVPVVDDRNCFIGIVLRRDVLSFLQDFYNQKNKDEKN